MRFCIPNQHKLYKVFKSTFLKSLNRSCIPSTHKTGYSQTSRATFIFKQYSDMSNQFLKIITTWCFALLIMNSAYIAFTVYTIDDINKLTDLQKNSCIVIGVFLHFFLIASFCLALSISIIQYFIFYKSFKIFKMIYLKAVLFSLVIPSIAVAIVLGIDTNAYINDNK